MTKFDLTKKEKQTLYGLVKYPDFSDRELSEKINLNISTITAIKGRLKKKNIIL